MVKPTLQQFAENSEVEYRLTVTVNGDDVLTAITGYDIENVIEQTSKMEIAVREALNEQYDDMYGLPEPEEEEVR